MAELLFLKCQEFKGFSFGTRVHPLDFATLKLLGLRITGSLIAQGEVSAHSGRGLLDTLLRDDKVLLDRFKMGRNGGGFLLVSRHWKENLLCLG